MDSEDRLVSAILRAAHTVHAMLGPGFTEGIYNRALIAELRNSQLEVEREKLIRIWYGPLVVGKHRLDLVVDHSVIVELKASRTLIPVNVAQLNSYLHASKFRVGLLLNFGTTELQWEIVHAPNGE